MNLCELSAYLLPVVMLILVITGKGSIFVPGWQNPVKRDSREIHRGRGLGF